MKYEHINEQTLHHPVYSYVKCVFNAQYLYVKHMNTWINEFHTISITKSLDVKFVIVLIKIVWQRWPKRLI